MKKTGKITKVMEGDEKEFKNSKVEGKKVFSLEELKKINDETTKKEDNSTYDISVALKRKKRRAEMQALERIK